MTCPDTVSTVLGMHTFTIELTRITWQAPDKSYTIAGAALDPEQAVGVDIKPWTNARCKTVKGSLGDAQVGDILDVMGDFQDSKYGKQFEVKSFVRCVANTNRAIVAFLKGFPQIGPARARAIVEHFGDHEATMAVMADDPDRLTEIKGITAERAAEIHAAFVEATGRRDAALFLGGFKNITEGLAARIMDKWGGRTRATLSADPYIVMELRGVGFKKADALANELGIVGEDPRRTAAAAEYVLQAATNEGHTYSNLNDLVGDGASRAVQQALKDVGITAALIEAGLQALSKPRQVGEHTRDPAVVIEGDRYYPATLHFAECGIGAHIGRLLTGGAS